MKHTCSLFLLLVLVVQKAPALKDPDAPTTKVKEDPAATKLLADARAARALWRDFPGFTADLEVNVDGKVTKGSVTVTAKGNVELKMKEGAAASWAKRELTSLVAHRLDSGPPAKTPCAFTDDKTDHPLGRAIRVLNDESSTSYRIRDRQILVVNRWGYPFRFTITVLENETNEDKQFLPTDYVVTSWEKESVKSSRSFHHTWRRVGKFDLPVSVLVVTAKSGSQQITSEASAKEEARRLRLSNHKLAP
jgi:hypothetical protein